ncbi:helix-turn-helix domain-containing protein [Terrihalobacillus insolitus]|uniref:helix-turn-helix domain-containing protein n=1 Tax=Terrihalobacillus insolitus TaxID=2950438 RepID=UPI00233F814D|nr:helix-turn-helix domain-containing protein [Terrihalobacillus insolitus]MDC3414773.1 helix-turn-helix domain-containing protein [Terrihalobacillus insolitus]
MNISEIIKKYRKKHNLSLRDLSSKTGISYSQLSKIERGESKPSNKSVLKILDIYDEELTSKELEGLIDLKEYLRNKNELLRYEVLSRDNFTCQLCGAVAPNVQVEIDQIIPNGDEKEAHIDNLITMCAKCHRARNILLNKDGIENDFIYMKYNHSHKESD